MMLLARRHRLSSAQLNDIAWGRPDVQAVQVLFDADDSRRRLLLAVALRRFDQAEPAVLEALAVLQAAQRRDQRMVAELLRISWLGPWATGLLSRRHRKTQQPANRLGALAAVAALRTGIDARLAVDLDDGKLHLPGTGTLTVEDHPNTEAVLESRGGRLDITVASHRLRLPTTPTRDWFPVRTVQEGALRLLIDDLHPGRDCFAEPPAQRLSEAAFRRWRDVTIASWRLLCRATPAFARQVAQGIRVIVPLAALAHGMDTSVSCVDALGAIATTTPSDPVRLAVTMVHEWSHSLLNGILGFVDLLQDPAGAQPSLYFAPWRPDPRPISGVLHGTFAFLAVAETWQALLTHDGDEQAAAELALRRLQLTEVLAMLPTAPELSEQGRRFVDILRRRNAALMDTPLHPRVVAAATARLDEQRAGWIRQRGS
jgi:HEXXH motif-containing protein